MTDCGAMTGSSWTDRSIRGLFVCLFACLLAAQVRSCRPAADLVLPRSSWACHPRTFRPPAARATRACTRTPAHHGPADVLHSDTRHPPRTPPGLGTAALRGCRRTRSDEPAGRCFGLRRFGAAARRSVRTPSERTLVDPLLCPSYSTMRTHPCAPVPACCCCRKASGGAAYVDQVSAQMRCGCGCGCVGIVRESD
jgi:hypothetical protein